VDVKDLTVGAVVRLENVLALFALKLLAVSSPTRDVLSAEKRV
jgi:hypothetical protein